MNTYLEIQENGLTNMIIYSHQSRNLGFEKYEYNTNYLCYTEGDILFPSWLSKCQKCNLCMSMYSSRLGVHSKRPLYASLVDTWLP